jgi:hypothetical protein
MNTIPDYNRVYAPVCCTLIVLDNYSYVLCAAVNVNVKILHKLACEAVNEKWKYRELKKKLYNGIPDVTVWRVLQSLHLKEFKLSIVQRLERWIVYYYYY